MLRRYAKETIIRFLSKDLNIAVILQKFVSKGNLVTEGFINYCVKAAHVTVSILSKLQTHISFNLLPGHPAPLSSGSQLIFHNRRISETIKTDTRIGHWPHFI